MEKKTIGGLIAALRKANGMTQKDLAEQLHVSDKTISRWERDDGTLDLAAIPVMAEIFGVTCDELLRGERRSPSARSEEVEEGEPTPKGEKQRQRLLKTTLSQYQNRTYIAMGVSVVGMIAALICNLAFLKAVLGFLIGAVFFASSLVCQAVFVNKAFCSVEDAGLDAMTLSAYKRKVISLAQKSVGLTVAFVGFTLPLGFVDAYLGLGADTLLLWGSIGAVAFLLVYAIVLYIINGSLVKNGAYSMTEEELAVYQHNRKLKKRCAVALVVSLAVTLLLQAIGSELLWSTFRLTSSRGQFFEDYESFVDYMEQDIPYDSGNRYYSGLFTVAEEVAVAPERAVEEEAITWYDEAGNEITEEEALTETLEDLNGNVVCTYISRNKNVTSIRYSPKDGTVLPIQVLTTGDYRVASRQAEWINLAYCILYPLELLAALTIYFKKRAK